jgi:L-aspartate oxidase
MATSHSKRPIQEEIFSQFQGSSHRATVLIAGSGIAGLSAAIHFSEFSNVILMAKSALDEGNTRYAQGGIATVWSDDDTFEEHIKDTLTAGAGMCHKDTVELCVKEGPARIKELLKWGVEFSKNEVGYSLHQEGGHHKRRILHSQDYTGLAIEEALIKKVRSIKNIKILERHMVVDLIMEGKLSPHPEGSALGECLGAYVLNCETNEVFPLASDLTILASGGMGKVYLYTTNPDVATGDGVAVAYRAGARIANLEFMQFHPTCLFHPNAKSFLITEALRGEGAIIRNQKGEDFMKHYHEMGSLAPRYVVSQSIDKELKKTGDAHAWLDVRHMTEKSFSEKFPQVYQSCRKFGIQVPQEMIPVVPAAHYMSGGILTDLNAETSVKGLLAIGEVACTGLHGANRLASNSLLEGVVFAKRAADHAREYLVKHTMPTTPKTLPAWDTGRAVDMEEQIDIAATWREIRTLMWNYVGIVRSDRRLRRARERLALIRHEVNEDYWKFKLNRDLVELRNLLIVAELTVECAIRRKESRGLHLNVDYPNSVSTLALDTII